MNDFQMLQTDFQDYLLQKNTRIETAVVSTEKVSAKTRLAIYADAYRLRLQEALERDYPALLHAMGANAFAQLAEAYCLRHPSQFRSVRWFGRYLPLFLQSQPPYSARSVLSDIARFEWALTEAFDALDSAVLDLAAFSQVPAEHWPHLRLVPIASARLVSVSWNVIPYWQAVTAGTTPPILTQTTPAVVWLMWRDEYQVRFRPLAESEAWAVRAVFNNEDFSTLCAGLCSWFPEDAVALQAATLVKSWVVGRWLSYFR